MPDTPPTPPTPPAKSKAPRGPINQAWLDEIDLANQLLGIATQEKYAANMTAEELNEAWFTAFSEKLTLAGQLTGRAVGATGDKGGITKDEETLKYNLLDALGIIQTRARRKYKKPGDPMRAKFFISKPIGASRAKLEGAADAILEVIKTDALPAIKEAEVTAVVNALKAYRDIQTSQTGAQGTATGQRTDLKTLIEEITDDRREIQYAADTQWPASNPAHRAVRIEFKLPPDKALA